MEESLDIIFSTERIIALSQTRKSLADEIGLVDDSELRQVYKQLDVTYERAIKAEARYISGNSEKRFYIDVAKLLEEPNGTHHKEKAKTCIEDPEMIGYIVDSLHHAVMALAGLVSFFNVEWCIGQDTESLIDFHGLVDKYILYAKPGTILEMLPNIHSAAQETVNLTQIIMEGLNRLIVTNDPISY